MANLASYHAYLNPTAQQEMITCLYKYLSFQCARLCITALTICTLEMREVMVKMLPQVLLSLSKISATDRIAIPVLEFLSSKLSYFKLNIQRVSRETASIDLLQH